MGEQGGERREGRGGEERRVEGRRGKGRGGKERAMSTPTIWKKFTPMVVVRPKRSLIKAAERPPATAHSASLTTNVRVAGNRMSSASGDAKVKGVPRRLTAFVSRLHKDTTEDDLCDMLQSAGIFDVKCTKLQSRDGRVFSTAAFRVSVSAAQRDAFYNSDIWPCGTELHDWVFYPPTRPISTEISD